MTLTLKPLGLPPRFKRVSGSTPPRPGAPIEINLGYTARRVFEPFHARRQRWACLVVHRRGGKTVACVMDLIDAAMRADMASPEERAKKPDPRFAYLAPTYAQAKDTAWEYLKRYTPLPFRAWNSVESDLMVRFRQRCGVCDCMALRTTSVCAALTRTASCWTNMATSIRARGRRCCVRSLADRNGWAVFIGTPKRFLATTSTRSISKPRTIPNGSRWCCARRRAGCYRLTSSATCAA